MRQLLVAPSGADRQGKGHFASLLSVVCIRFYQNLNIIIIT